MIREYMYSVNDYSDRGGDEIFFSGRKTGGIRGGSNHGCIRFFE